MTYDEKRRRYVVRWRENGRRRARRFETPEEAEVFERSLAEPVSATDEQALRAVNESGAAVTALPRPSRTTDSRARALLGRPASPRAALAAG